MMLSSRPAGRASIRRSTPGAISEKSTEFPFGSPLPGFDPEKPNEISWLETIDSRATSVSPSSLAAWTATPLFGIVPPSHPPTSFVTGRLSHAGVGQAAAAAATCALASVAPGCGAVDHPVSLWKGADSLRTSTDVGPQDAAPVS